MKTIRLCLLFASVAVFSLTSCKKDKENPTITVTEPAEHSEYALGSTIHVEATFADDRDLKSFTMEVGDVDGGHIEGFHFDYATTTSGKAYDYHTMITMPDSLSTMMFYLHFTVTDQEGKTATQKHMLHKM